MSEQKQYGHLTFIETIGLRKRVTGIKREMWAKFLCDCGNIKETRFSDVKMGRIISCGCINRMNAKMKNYQHGESKERLYSIWNSMRKRCYYKTQKSYKHYGGRGIIICDDWKENYLKFREWAVSNGYASNLTIDRINSNGNYEPNNCRWITQQENNNNRKNTIFLNVNGKQMCLYDCAKIYNIRYSKLFWRIKNGWSDEKAISVA